MTDRAEPVHRRRDPGARDHRSEAEAVVDRIQAAHPGVPVERIAELVETAFVELRDAKVQTYRAILAERSVERSLRHGTVLATADLRRSA